MSLRSKLIRLAHENPELRAHLLPLIRKTAGGFSIKVFNVPEKQITPGHILKAMAAAGWTDIDPATLEYERPREAKDTYGPNFLGGMAEFRAYPKGAKSREEAVKLFNGYPWGYVLAGLEASGKNVTVSSVIYIKV